MNIICLVKFVPDTDNFVYDHERHLLLRENMDLILNPDDASALACALKLKQTRADVRIKVVTMAPRTVLDQLRDLVRLHVDRAVLISDRAYAGSDTYATAHIIARYIRETGFDLILSGTHSLDGGTAHIPPQLAVLLGDIPQVSEVYQVDELAGDGKSVIVETEDEDRMYTWQVELPAVISMTRNIAYKLPFVRYADLDLDVDNQIRIITNEELGLKQDETGIGGSLTRVVRTWAQTVPYKEKVVLTGGDDGAEAVYRFLADHNFV
jgi:electron transfer flavoprotein beta subunit